MNAKDRPKAAPRPVDHHTDPNNTDCTAQVRQGLDVARALAAAGVPIFTAPPALDGNGRWLPDGGHGNCGYWLPKGWQGTAADPSVIDSWEPGQALCAVMGHTVDGADIDPRNGGDKSANDIESAGLWPRNYGIAETPSGGTHELIAPLNVASKNEVRDGLDIKSGKPDGSGRGFLFIAPTVKLSKDTGELGQYRWVKLPDLDALDGADDSGDALAGIVEAARNGQPSETNDAALTDPAKVGVQWADLFQPDAVPPGKQDDALFRAASYLRRKDLPDTLAIPILRAVVARFANGNPADPWTPRHADDKWRSVCSRYTPGDADHDAGVSFDTPADGQVMHLHHVDGVPNVSGLINWSEFWTTEHTDDDWLVEPILPRARSIITYAPAGAYKSLLALYVAVRLATGQHVLDQPAAEPTDVLYLDLEQSPAELQERLRAMGYGPETDLSRFHYYLLPDLDPLDTAEGGRVVRDLAERHGAQLVIIDTTSRVISGKENDADTFLNLYRHTGKLLRADGRTVWMLDHSGKDATLGPRGSSAKASDVDIVWRQTDRDDGQVRMETGKPSQGLKCRISWARHVVDLKVQSEPTRIQTVQNSWPAGTKNLAELLDRLDVPTGHGRGKAREALTAAGHEVRNDVLAAAVRFRKNHLPTPVDNPVDNSGTGAGTGQNTDSGTGAGTGDQESLNQAPGQVSGQSGTGTQGDRGQVPVPIRGQALPHLELHTLNPSTSKVVRGQGNMPCDICNAPTVWRINDRPGCHQHLTEAGGDAL